jgi:hypothetical protein
VVAAVWPFEFHPVNRVSWLAGQNGVHFHGRGMVHSLQPLVLNQGGARSGTLTIQIALEADGESRSHVGQVLSFFDAQGTETLVLGQWEAGLSIFSLGVGRHSRGNCESVPESRSRGRGYYEIGLDDTLTPRRPHVLTIASGSTGTTIHVDQAVAAQYCDAVADVLFRAPSRFIIGTSVTGGDEWTGKVFWLAFYDRELTADEIREDQRTLLDGAGGRHAPARPGRRAFYAFDERAGTRVRDAAGGAPLEMPTTLFALEKRVLTPPWEEYRRGEFSAIDAEVNVLGFVPVGLLFTLWCVTNLRLGGRTAVLIAVALGLVISVLIELGQVWMPDRTSSATDVITNVTGAALGAAAACWYLGVRGRCAHVLPGK